MVVGEGFEPSKSVTADYSLLPLAAWVSHLSKLLNGAGTKSRTRDLLITSQLLYQLSYAGIKCCAFYGDFAQDATKKSLKLFFCSQSGHSSVFCCFFQ